VTEFKDPKTQGGNQSGIKDRFRIGAIAICNKESF